MDIISKLKLEFNKKYAKNSKIRDLVERLENGDAAYEQAHEFAIEVGEILANVFKENLSADMFPDGKISYSIADNILNETLGNNYNFVSDYSRDIQTIINKKAGFNIKGVKADKNQSRIDNMAKKVSDDSFENVQWVFDEPIKNFTQSVVDDTVKANADFQYKLGMQPKIIRKSTGNCCDWCEALVGEYDYPDEVPKDVYRRHKFCRCTVEHRPVGKKVGTNIHTKKIMNSDEDIAARIRRYEKEIRISENNRIKNISTAKAIELGYKPLEQEKVVNILRKQSEKWIANLTEDEKRAIQKYTDNGIDKDGKKLFEKINGYLANKYNPINELEEKMLIKFIYQIDNALLKNELQSDIIVYRKDVSPKSIEGEINRFLSTSVTQKGVFGSSPNVAIIVPKGSKGGYVESFSNYKDQREYMLSYGATLKKINDFAEFSIYKVEV